MWHNFSTFNLKLFVSLNVCVCCMLLFSFVSEQTCTWSTCIVIWQVAALWSEPWSTSVCVTGGSTVLEVIGLPPNLRQTELPSQLCDLTKLGARLQIVASDEGAAGDSQQHQGGTECTVIAIFESDLSAQQALALHKGNRYRLKLASRSYDIARVERPISWQYLFL